MHTAILYVTPLTKRCRIIIITSISSLNLDCAVCVDKEGKVAGFGLAFPSIATACKAAASFTVGFIRLYMP